MRSNRRQTNSKRFQRANQRRFTLESLEARRLLTTNIGIVRTDGTDLLQWKLDNEPLLGTRNTAAEISFAYGLKSGAPGAGVNGNDAVLAGDMSGVGFDQAWAVRRIGSTLQWRGDTDRDTTQEYLFRFGVSPSTPLTADLNGDGFDDLIAVLGDGASLQWHVHCWQIHLVLH